MLGKSDKEDKIFICLRNCDLVAHEAAEGVPATFITAKWRIEKQEAKWEIWF